MNEDSVSNEYPMTSDRHGFEFQKQNQNQESEIVYFFHKNALYFT